jgi:outer membrane biosynthesis protein TonB
MQHGSGARPSKIDSPMTYWLDEPRNQHELVTVRTLWVTIVLSLLVHFAALLVVITRTHLMAPDEGGKEAENDRLQVRLAAPERPPIPVSAPEPPREILAVPKAATRPPRTATRAPSPPPVIASTTEAPRTPAPPPPAPPAAPPAPAPPKAAQPVETDLWSYIQNRRRERGAPQESASDSQEAERNANLAANLPRSATGAASADLRKGGGIFEIKRMGYDDAAFVFNGWNENMGRTTPQLVEVRKGNNANMQIAVVRRMIAIIREHSHEDFVWRSPQRDRDVVLSARLSDNAALEDFLMHDFFDDRGRSP